MVVGRFLAFESLGLERASFSGGYQAKDSVVEKVVD